MKSESFILPPSEWVPNNRRYPVVVYREVIASPGTEQAASAFEQLFQQNGWPPRWRNGVYSYHHYHSTAHEVLGFAAGAATLLLGGPGGREVSLKAGDAVLLPAGTGHCRIHGTADFLVVGAYPPEQDWDLCRGPSAPEVVERMVRLPYPASDPVGGKGGPLQALWP